VIVTVVDQCPISSNDKCIAGHIDLSVAAFMQLGTASEGYLGERAGRGRISLRHVSCPEPDTIKLALKEPQNANWNQLLVASHRHALARVEVQVGGNWLGAARESHNYWTPPGGIMGSSPYQVRLTDVHGHTVDTQIALNEPGLRDTGRQFPDCTP
jgi:expansin (peptidoglycan-binding protein)